MLAIVACFTSATCVNAQEQSKTYTKDHPLVYEDLWDMAPYSYLDENGMPNGYNIDLVKIVLDRLGIPYVIKLYHSDEVFDDIRSRKADLGIGMYAPYHFGRGHFGKSVITLFTQSIAKPKKDTKVIKGLSDLKGEKIYMRPSSFAYSEMVKNGMKRYVEPTIDMKAALMKVNETGQGMVLWNTLALQNIAKRYKLDDVSINAVNMDHGEYRFISQDTLLLTMVDSVFVQMEMDETITQLRKKWFYPETLNEDTYIFVQYAIAMALVLFVGAIFYYLYFRYRERTMRSLLDRQTQRLSLYLESGKVRLFSFDVATRNFHAYHSFVKGTNSQELYTVATFAQYFVDKDFAKMMGLINEIAAGMRETAKLNVYLRRTRMDEKVFLFELNLKVLRMKDGVPSVILGTLLNLDEDRKKADELRLTILKFRMMFDTAVVDMIYCDNDGVIVDMNEKACKSFGIRNRKELIDSHYSIGKMNFLYNQDINMNEKHWSTSMANLDELRRQGLLDEKMTRHGMMFYEVMIVPIFNGEGQRIGIFVSGRDVSETIDFFKKENLRTKRIQIATDRLQRYVDNINYALSVSQIRLAHYSPQSRSFDLVYDLNRPPMVVSQLRCVRLVTPEYRHDAEGLLLRMDRLKQKRFAMRFKTKMKDPVTGLPVYYQVSGVPTMDKDGEVMQYFCLLRDVTHLVATEEALQEQTKKAQEAETLKNTFLKNMSHEIRTPLNAVVGFAELFEKADNSPEDEVIFSNQIKENSKKLLYLVNDILLLSRIDAKMVDINPEPVDIIETFKTRCLMAWSTGLSESVHTMIECQFDKLVVNVDANQVGYVVETLSKTAARFTDHGSIRTKLDYFNGELVLKFEDTGRGIDSETQKRIFDIESRFEGDYSTSGLELVIVSKLVKLMGGNIFVESQLGKGTTFRVTLPCELQEKEKSEGTSTMDFTFA